MPLTFANIYVHFGGGFLLAKKTALIFTLKMQAVASETSVLEQHPKSYAFVTGKQRK